MLTSNLPFRPPTRQVRQVHTRVKDRAQVSSFREVQAGDHLQQLPPAAQVRARVLRDASQDRRAPLLRKCVITRIPRFYVYAATPANRPHRPDTRTRRASAGGARVPGASGAPRFLGFLHPKKRDAKASWKRFAKNALNALWRLTSNAPFARRFFFLSSQTTWTSARRAVATTACPACPSPTPATRTSSRRCPKRKWANSASRADASIYGVLGALCRFGHIIDGCGGIRNICNTTRAFSERRT